MLIHPTKKELKKRIKGLETDLENQKELITLLRNGKDYLKTELREAHAKILELKDELNGLYKTRYNPVLADVIALLDTIWRCRTHDGNVQDFICGMMDAYAACTEALTKHNIVIYNSLDKPFNPREHEAIGIEINNELPENTVVQELTRGVAINGKIFRYAQVIVSKKGSDFVDK